MCVRTLWFVMCDVSAVESMCISSLEVANCELRIPEYRNANHNYNKKNKNKNKIAKRCKRYKVKRMIRIRELGFYSWGSYSYIYSNI